MGFLREERERHEQEWSGWPGGAGKIVIFFFLFSKSFSLLEGMIYNYMVALFCLKYRANFSSSPFHPSHAQNIYLPTYLPPEY